MGVWINEERKTVSLNFDGVTGDEFTVRATNEADDEAHSSGPHPLQKNPDGTASFVESFPATFEGDVHIEITGSDGSRTEGDVTIT